MDPDKKEFLSQYKEYDDKPYAIRKMAKYILEKGEANYPTYSSEEALERSLTAIKRALETIPEDVRKEIERMSLFVYLNSPGILSSDAEMIK
jgi:hypothetical protein